MYQVFVRVPTGIMLPYAQHPTPLAALRAAEYADRYIDIRVHDMATGRDISLAELRRRAARGGYPPAGGAA